MHTAKRSVKTAFLPWVNAARPKTLTASIIPFLAGTALAATEGVAIQWNLLLCALMSALCIQTGTHLINDAVDFAKGTDTPERIGPLRAIHCGIATERQVYCLGMTFFALAFLFGIPLIVNGGPLIAIILLASMLAGYFYTAGTYPLAYCGLGDPFVLLFYGWIATFAAYWLQTGQINLKGFLLGTQIGLLCTSIIIVNNFRDMSSDAKSGKNTLAVIFGELFTRIEFASCIIIPFILNLFWLHFGYTFVSLLPFAALPLGLYLINMLFKTAPSPIYNKFLALTALLHLSFGLLLILGFWFE